jgi:hypothetical protein
MYSRWRNGIAPIWAGRLIGAFSRHSRFGSKVAIVDNPLSIFAVWAVDWRQYVGDISVAGGVVLIA